MDRTVIGGGPAYRSLEIENFRGLAHVRFDRLARVNVLTGLNGSGKTTVLEALVLHAQSFSPAVSRLDANRGHRVRSDNTPPWRYLFAGEDAGLEIRISGETVDRQWTSRFSAQQRPGDFVLGDLVLDETEDRSGIYFPRVAVATLRIELTSSDRHWQGTIRLDSGGSLQETFPVGEDVPEVPLVRIWTEATTTSAQMAASFAVVQRSGAEEDLYVMLRNVERRLERLLIWTDGKSTALHADLGGGLTLPLPLVSDGLTRIAGAALSAHRAKNGVLLIDEIENGIHVSVLGDYWRTLHQLALDNNVQVFATTHSAECVEAAAAALPEHDLLLHRMYTKRGVAGVQTFDSSMLAAAIDADLAYR